VLKIPSPAQSPCRVSSVSALAWLFLGLDVICHAEGTNDLAQICPGAAKWRAEHPEQLAVDLERRDRGATFTDLALRQELQRRVDADQEARKALLAAPQDAARVAKVSALDNDNLQWLRALVVRQDLPTMQQVGFSGVHWAWLLAEHANSDPRFQGTLLLAFEKRFTAGELPADDLARLTDRVLLNQGRPQQYGTQFDWYTAEFKLPSGDPLSKIEVNRNRLGLMPLSDYACMMLLRSRRLQAPGSE
jgi:hypothetical protein